MKYGILTNVTLFKREGLGDEDFPKGEGYSPYFVVDSSKSPIAVRFLDYKGPWDKPSKVKVELCHGMGPKNYNISIGQEIKISMGNKTVGIGTILSEILDIKQLMDE